jgi:hypothetical protein
MIALVCTAVQEEVLGVRCKLMLQFLQKAQGRIDTESGRSDHFDFLNAKFGVPAEEVEGGVDLSELPQQEEGSPSHPCLGLKIRPPGLPQPQPPRQRMLVMCIAHVLLQGAQQGASSEDGSR